MKPRRLALALALVTVAVSASHLPASAEQAGIKLGFTHGQYSADGWGNPQAVSRAHALIHTSFTLQNQHLMGWGTLNPEPSPGVYDFRSLDARVQIMLATGATPVITLCCSPDWMKGGAAGSTDWKRIEEAPLPEHYDEFANLAAIVARRYPQVRHFVVWNEMKGFYDKSRNRWNVEAYTELYNQVAAALKAVDPGIQVGGPYLPMDSWSSATIASHPSTVQGPWGVLDRRVLEALDYWLANANHADFVSIDGGTGTKDKGLVTDPVAATAKFADVTAAVRARTSLPIWWSEVHLRLPKGASNTTVVAAQREAITQLESSGAAVALFWSPEQEPGIACATCLWTSTRVQSGGQATPLLTGLTDMLVERRP